jgi:hypothetical protein
MGTKESDMDRVLNLVSPIMHGKDVRNMQGLLAKNKFGNFKPGPVDGNYGEVTAGASRRAKFWLGYPKKRYTEPGLKFQAGPRLAKFLSGKEGLPLAYRIRRKRRLKAAGEKPLREKMLAEAKRHIGVKESPAGSNKVLFSTWYGSGNPAWYAAWCAMFVSFCGVKSGATKTFIKGTRYAYTPFMVHDARLGEHGMSTLTKDQVKPGHIVMFDFGMGGTKGSQYNTDHTGLFDKWTNESKGIFKTVEGNTSVTSDSNGGEVMARERNTRQVIAFIQVEL